MNLIKYILEKLWAQYDHEDYANSNVKYFYQGGNTFLINLRERFCLEYRVYASCLMKISHHASLLLVSSYNNSPLNSQKIAGALYCYEVSTTVIEDTSGLV
jgi:hypothetical protein